MAESLLWKDGVSDLKPAVNDDRYPDSLNFPQCEYIGSFRMMRLPYGSAPRTKENPGTVREGEAQSAFDAMIVEAQTEVGGVYAEDLLICPGETPVQELGGIGFVQIHMTASLLPDKLTLALRYIAARMSPSVRAFVAFPAGKEGDVVSKAAAAAFGAERVWRSCPKEPWNQSQVRASIAESLPVGGNDHCKAAEELTEEIDAYLASGGGRGLSTGYDKLDDYYTVSPGELTLVTGYPNQGKSEFVDQLAVNLWRADGGGTAFFSPENMRPEHCLKIAEKIAGVERKDPRIAHGRAAMGKDFFWITPPRPTISAILSQAEGLAARGRIKRLVIDPYNEIEREGRASESETEYISRMLTEVKAFAKRRSVHIWFIAHPRKPEGAEKEDIPPPGLSAISGSQHWINKADCGLVVARGQNFTSKIFVRKIRNKRVGKIGDCLLAYDPPTGIFSNLDPRYSHE